MAVTQEFIEQVSEALIVLGDALENAEGYPRGAEVIIDEEEISNNLSVPGVMYDDDPAINNNARATAYVQIPWSVLSRVLAGMKEATEHATEVVADVDEIVEAAENATTAANNAADNANTKASLANTAAANANSSRQAIEANESTRQSNETTRQTNESGRVTAESGRVTAESGRVTAENSRVSAETARETQASSNPWTDYDANLIYLPPAKFCEGMEITIITSLYNNAGALGQYFTYAVSNDFATTNPIIENSQLECGNRFAVISQDSNVTTVLQNTFEIQDYGVAQSVYLYHVLQTNATKVTFVATRNPFADGFISDSAKLPDCIAWCMIDAKVASNV